MSESLRNEKLKKHLIKLEIPLNDSFEEFQKRLSFDFEANTYSNWEIATNFHSLAQTYMMQGNLDRAELYFEKATEFYRITIDKHSLVLSLSQYALVLRPQLKSEKAEVLLVEVVKISKKLGLKLKDIKNMFLKCYFLNLIEIYNERDEAKKLRKLLLQEWQRASD
jgi:tetratricopeptide (TPR) repeat protein